MQIQYIDITPVPPVLRNLSLESVLCQLLETQAAIDVAAYPTILSTYGPMSDFDAVVETITKTPLSKEAGTAVPKIWEALDILSKCEARTAVSIRAQRQRIMFLHYTVWDWLQVGVNEACEGYLHDSTRCNDWISRLAKKVDTLYTTGTKRAIINPITFIDYAHAEPYEYRAYRIPSVDDDARFAFVHATVMTIVQQWLLFPEGGLSIAKYWFLDTVIRNITPAGLLLDEVWVSFGFLKTQVFEAPKRKSNFKKEDFDFLEEAFQMHPIANKQSHEFAALQQLQTTVQQFLFSRSQEPPKGPPEKRSNTRRSSTALHARKTLSVVGLAIAKQPTVPRTGRPEHMLGFLRALKGLITLDLASGEVCTQTELAQFVTKDTDKHLPFREYGRSRLRIKQDGGPFSPSSNIRTEAGFFSSLIFRGITFNSDFLRSKDHRTLFRNHTDWAETVASVQQDLLNQSPNLTGGDLAQFFCVKTAYGQPMARSIEYAADYARTAFDPSHNAWLLEDETPSYITLWKTICSVNPPRSEQRAAYPQMGPLIGHLLVADYVYAGVIPMPSVDDMADIIWEINKGGARGLVALGLLPEVDGGARQSKQGVRDALNALYRFLQDNLDIEEQMQMIFDIIMLEHALCKYVRCVNKNLTW